MAASVEELFEHALRERGLPWTRDSDSGRYTVQADDITLTISIDNLRREFARDSDVGCVSRFIDSVLRAQTAKTPEWSDARNRIIFCLEPTGYVQPPELRMPISEQVDRVSALLDDSSAKLTWLTKAMLHAWNVAPRDIEDAALANLAAALRESSLEWKQIDAVRLGFFATHLPFKSPLLLAPNLKDLIAKEIGWPILAVVPDRDFVYIWAAEHRQFAQRVGAVVLQQYSKSPYPVAKEVFRIDDSGISAIGAFADPGAD